MAESPRPPTNAERSRPSNNTVASDGGAPGVLAGVTGFACGRFISCCRHPDGASFVCAADAARVPQTVKRITTSHEMTWANAIMGKAEPSSDIAYAARLTETMLLGIVALRTGQGQKIYYDAANMRVTNSADANQYLQREYRAGWSL